MRTKVLIPVLGIATLLLANSCQKKETTVSPSLSLAKTEITVSAAGGPQSIDYKVTNPTEGSTLKVEVPADWVTDVDVTESSITFSVAENMGTEARNMDVTVTYPGADAVKFTVKQEAAVPVPSVEFESASVDALAEGGQYSMTYVLTNPTEGAVLTATVDAEASAWITELAVNEANSSIDFTVLDNGSSKPRSAKVTVSYPGMSQDAEFTVNQAGKEVEYTINPNWTVTYDGKVVDPQYGLCDILTVTVSAGTDGFLYSIVTASDYEKYGINVVAESEIDYYREQLDKEPTLTWDDLLSYETTSAYYSPLTSGIEYYGFAIGVDKDGNPTGQYAISQLFTPEEVQASEAYSKWLGDWRIEDADGNGYDITISALEPEVSYAMSGWEASVFNGSAPDVTLGYDAASGELIFETNEEMGQVTLSNNEQVELGFYGNGDDGFFYTGEYDIAVATLADDNTATVAGNTLESNDGPVTMISMQFFGLGTNGNYSFSEEPVFPLTMSKVASAGSTSVATRPALAKAVKANTGKVSAKATATAKNIR